MNAWGTGIKGFEILDLAADPFSIGGYKSEYSFISGFLKLNYNYADTYYLSASVRRDGSSRFGQDNRYGNFYALGGSWILTNESFFPENIENVLSNFKLRAEYGVNGNADIGNYAAQSLQNYGLVYNGSPGSYPATLGNVQLTWEKQKSLDLGFDAELFDGRIELNFDVYQKTNEDLLQAVPLPYESGFNSQLQNISSVRNRGLEVGLATINIQGVNFQWNTNFNISWNKNKVLSIAQDEPVIQGQKIIKEGLPINTWYLRKWAGVDPENGDPLWEKIVADNEGNEHVELTNNYNEATQQPVGQSTPNITGGISNTFSYKNINLDVLFDYVYGNKVYSQIIEHARADGGYLTWNQLDLSNYDHLSRWQNPGDQATEPKAMPGGNNLAYFPSSRFLMDGSYFRLRNIKLSYELPQRLLSKLGTKGARIYVSGNNLWTITSEDYIGPDPSQFINGYEARADKYPISRTFMFGLNLSL